MTPEDITITDRTVVQFAIDGDRVRVSIRDGMLRIEGNFRLAVYPRAANAVTVGVDTSKKNPLG